MKTMNDITRDALAIVDALQESEGEITPEIETLMALNEQEFADKADAYAYIIGELEGLAKQRAEQIKALTAIKRTAENAAERMRGRMLDVMRLLDMQKTQTANHVLSIRNNRESVKIDDETLLPDEAFAVKREASKTLIAQLIADGVEVNGAHMERTQSLSIR